MEKPLKRLDKDCIIERFGSVTTTYFRDVSFWECNFEDAERRLNKQNQPYQK